MWRKGNPCALSVEMQIDAVTMENSMAAPQSIKDRTAMWSSNSTPGYIFKGNEITILKIYLYSHAHCSIFTRHENNLSAQ